MTADPDGRPLLLIIGTGWRDYREYLLASISTQYRVHLLLWAEPSWERDYLTGWTVLSEEKETKDVAEMLAAARDLAAREPLDGVLAWDEARVLQVAKVAAALGLRGGDPDAALRTRDKSLTRAALASAGVPQARSVLVASLAEALDAAGQIGYPVVVKPRAMAASLGAVLVTDPGELAARFAFARDAYIPGAWRYDVGVLVEEYLTGPEISVDSAVHDGRVYPMFVAHKEVGYPPYFEEVGHVVDARDPLLADPDLLTLLQDTHTGLGFTDGMTHTEVKLTPAGPKIIEVNGRLGGDLIPYLGLRASGIDPGLAAAAVACGREPAVTADRSLVGAVRFFYPDHNDTEIASVSFDGVAMPKSVDLIVPVATPGWVVSPPPKGTTFGRIAFATALGGTAEECREALDAAQAALRVDEVPTDPEPAAGSDRPHRG
jgi:biotin carboxylase